VVSSGGRRALTHYEVERELPGASLVRVTLGTGRTHQIRVHFAAAGWPVLGDRTYGGARTEAGSVALRAPIARQALHAARLGFAHPVTGKQVELTSPLPEDMRSLIETLQVECTGSMQKRGGRK
jgi:23S rRNA pseudouridine1911/1915/1917 synthase